MYNERDHEWKIGPKGHALRSLAMYYERVYQSGPAWQSQHGRRFSTISSPIALVAANATVRNERDWLQHEGIMRQFSPTEWFAHRWRRND